MKLFSIILTIALSILLIGCDNSSSTTPEQASATQLDNREKSGQNRFVLTHMLGEKLDKEAHFYVDGEKWKLDYNNGNVVYYQVISGRSDTPLCGIKTIDSFNDDCEICITKEEIKTIVQFKYNKGTLSFEGYYDK